MPFFAACCQVVGHVHVLSHISFLTPSIIPLYSCIDVHVCGEIKLQPVHVFYEDAGGVNIGHVTTVSTDGKGEGGGGGGEESNGTTTVWQIHPPPPSRMEEVTSLLTPILFFNSSTGLAPFPGRGQ